jgi:hypothetical protein
MVYPDMVFMVPTGRAAAAACVAAVCAFADVAAGKEPAIAPLLKQLTPISTAFPNLGIELNLCISLPFTSRNDLVGRFLIPRPTAHTSTALELQALDVSLRTNRFTCVNGETSLNLQVLPIFANLRVRDAGHYGP